MSWLFGSTALGRVVGSLHGNSGYVPPTPPVPLTVSLMDTFAGGSVSLIDGHVVQPDGGAAWTQTGTSAGVRTSPMINASGKMGFLGSNANNNKAAGYLTLPGNPAEFWATYHFDPTSNARLAPITYSSGNSVVMLTNYSGSGSVNNSVQTNIGLDGGRMGSWASTVRAAGLLDAGTATAVTWSAGTGLHSTIFGGDTFQIRQRAVGAARYQDLYYCGFLVNRGSLDIATLITPTATAGVTGSGGGGNTTTSPVLIESIEMGDPASHAMLTVRRAGKVAQVKWWDGSLDMHLPLEGEYTLAAPTSLVVTLKNAVTGAVITGYDRVPLAGLTASAGNWKGTFTAAAASVSTGSYYTALVERLDGVTARGAHTPVFTFGWTGAQYGQSLTTLWWQSTLGTVFTDPPNAFVVDGASDGTGGWPTTIEDSRVRPINATLSNIVSQSHTSYKLSFLAALAGHSNFSHISAGHGGTSAKQRAVGTTPFNRLLEGIRLQGDLSYYTDNEGAFEVTNGSSDWGTFGAADGATYKAIVLARHAALEADRGHPVKCILAPTPRIKTSGASGDQRMQNLQRARMELVWANGGYSDGITRFHLGAAVDDMMGTGDTYHLVNGLTGWGEMSRRYAFSEAKALGLSSTDRAGADIVGVFRDSDSSIRVRLDRRGATALTLSPGVGYLSDYNCGFWFDPTSSAFGNPKAATGAPTLTDVGGGLTDATFTFAAGTFPTSVYFRGPWGQYPYNAGNLPAGSSRLASNASTMGDPMNRFSMILSTFGDTGNFYDPPVRRWFNPAYTNGEIAQDYLSA